MPPMTPRTERALLAAIVMAFLTPTLVAVSAQIALGYDEAVYGQLTRHWLTGAPASGWDLHRPPGLSALGVVPQLLSPGNEPALRLIGVISGTGLVAAGWRVARGAGSTVAGFVAAVALAASSPLQVESASYLTDVPSSLVLLLIAGLAWRHLNGAAPIRGSIVWLGPLAAVAFYLRYGAVLELAGLAAAAALVAPRRLLDAWRPVAAAFAAFTIALLPHIAIALAETGEPWGILASAGRAAGGGEGLPLVDYVAWFPWRLIGPLGAVLALVGIVGAFRGAGDGLPRFLGLAAVLPIAVLGTLVHAEPRYPLFPMVLLVVAGAATAAPLLSPRLREQSARAVVGGLAAAALVLAAAFTGSEIGTRAVDFDWKREAGRDIGVAGAGDCSVLTADVPIIAWYSGCPSVNFLSGEATDRIGLLTGSERFVIVRADGHLQPPPEVIQTMLADTEVWRTYEDRAGRVVAIVHRLATR